MKKFVSILCIFVLTAAQIGFMAEVAPIKANAAIDYTCGENLTWSLDVDTGELIISGTGEMYNYINRTKNPPWANYRDYIKSLVVNSGVTSIGQDAFMSCKSLSSVSLPSTIKKIGDSAFSSCDSLTEITIPEGVTEIIGSAFWSCDSLKCITLPSTLKIISATAFDHTISLKEILFPNGSNLISLSGSFADSCKWYSDIIEGPVCFGGILHEYKGVIEEDTVLTIENGTRMIKDKVFENQIGIIDLIVPDSLFAVGADAFSGTSWLENHANGEVYVGNVFYTYKGLMGLGQEILLPKGTTGIADYAFAGCDLLEKIKIPDSLLYVGSYAFQGTKLLHDISLNRNLKYLDDWAFSESYIKEIIFPAGIEYMGRGVFCDSEIENVMFEYGYSYHEIPYMMFAYCPELNSFTIPSSIRIIDHIAFENCNGLSVTIPKETKTIVNGAFKNCDNLVIYCYTNSSAHTYAVKNEIPFVILDEVVNTESLTTLLEQAYSVNRTFYSDETLAELDASISAVNLNAENLTQTQVNEWEAAIKFAIDNLKYKPADYYAVETAQKRAESLDRSLYTAESLALLDSALNSVEENLDITNQSKVNSIARAINEAIDNLEYLPANYTKVEDAISESQELDRRLYSQATLAVLDQSISAVEYGLNITEQAKVDGFAEQISNAISALEYADVVLRNEPHGVIVSATAKEIDPDTALTVDLKDSSDLQSGNFAVGGTVKSITLYDINLLLNAQKTQPNGFVTVKIKLPNGVDPKRCKVYHVIDDPVDPLVRYTTALEGNFIVFETDHFSEFAVIEVETVLNSIEITKLPNKTVYALGETVNTSGLEVTAHYSDGSTKIVSDYDVSSVDTSSIGTKTITVYHTYNGVTKSDSFEITVNGDKIAANITLNGEDINEYNKKVAWYKGYSSESVKFDCSATGNYKVEWSSDNSKVLVDSNGNVTNKGFFFPRKATITVKVTDSAGNVLATDSIIVRFYKLSFQLSSIQSTIVQAFKKSGLIF